MRSIFDGKDMTSLEVCFEKNQLKIRVRTCVNGQGLGDGQWTNTYEASPWVELTEASAETLESTLHVVNMYPHDNEDGW